MARGSEAALRALFRDKVKAAFPGCHYQRIESPMTSGTPDSVVAIKGTGDNWVEFKFLKRMAVRPHALIKVGLRDEQAAWIISHNRAGGRCYVLLQVQRTGYFAFYDEPAIRALHAGIPAGLVYPRLYDWAVWHGKRLDFKPLAPLWGTARQIGPT